MTDYVFVVKISITVEMQMWNVTDYRAMAHDRLVKIIKRLGVVKHQIVHVVEVINSLSLH